MDPVDLSRSGGSGGSGDEFQTYDFVWEVLTKSALGGPIWSHLGHGEPMGTHGGRMGLHGESMGGPWGPMGANVSVFWCTRTHSGQLFDNVFLTLWP